MDSLMIIRPDRCIHHLALRGKIADRTSDFISPDLTREEQVSDIATGKGFLGTSLQCVENIAEHFAAPGIVDNEVVELLACGRAEICFAVSRQRELRLR